ncbi:hypothetical protein BDD12DRAFT_825683 [Trichophaea hybrida]|nr:hypothetical protein BDD12DRAFT_825683 [Trichophaea hybrida]
MIRKRKAIPLILHLLVFLLQTVQAQDILVFDNTTGLPNCAHDCPDLYSAQYECPPGGDRVDCFCDSGYVSSKPQGWGCDNSCTTKTERERVAAFLTTTCGTQEDEQDNARPANDKNHLGGSNSTNTDSTTDPQAAKAANWWRNNWFYFFLAFMLVAIAVLALAFTGPIRKYLRRQSIKRRSRQSSQGIPYWEPSAPGFKISSVTQTRRYSDPLSDPLSPPVQEYYYGSGGLKAPRPQRGLGLSYINSGGLGSYSEVGTPSDPGPQSHGPGPALTLPPGPTIRTLFASHAAVSTRQESWERRMREEHRKKGWFARKFWRGGNAGDDSEKPYGAVGYNIGRAV